MIDSSLCRILILTTESVDFIEAVHVVNVPLSNTTRYIYTASVSKLWARFR